MPFIRAIIFLAKWLLGLDQEKPLQVIDNAQLINALRLCNQPANGLHHLHGDDGRNSVLFPKES